MQLECICFADRAMKNTGLSAFPSPSPRVEWIFILFFVLASNHHLLQLVQKKMSYIPSKIECTCSLNSKKAQDAANLF